MSAFTYHCTCGTYTVYVWMYVYCVCMNTCGMYSVCHTHQLRGLKVETEIIGTGYEARGGVWHMVKYDIKWNIIIQLMWGSRLLAISFTLWWSSKDMLTVCMHAHKATHKQTTQCYTGLLLLQQICYRINQVSIDWFCYRFAFQLTIHLCIHRQSTLCKVSVCVS